MSESIDMLYAKGETITLEAIHAALAEGKPVTELEAAAVYAVNKYILIHPELLEHEQRVLLNAAKGETANWIEDQKHLPGVFQCECERCATALYSNDKRKSYRLCTRCEEIEDEREWQAVVSRDAERHAESFAHHAADLREEVGL